jgi:bifunctional non-homologous end joining protein LigD
MAKAGELEAGGRRIKVSNLDKVLYPEAGFTKADVINYYIRISDFLLPHLKDRALTLKRYPDGVNGEFFYEKQCPAHRPPWVKTAAIRATSDSRTIDYCVVNDLSTLVWAANLADLELHTSLAKSNNPDRPTMMVFDLDPGPPANIVQCCRVGLKLRELLHDRRLNSYPKTSGSKGLQIYVALNTTATYEQTKSLAQSMAEQLASEYPREVVSKMAKNLRKNKVFVDWSQNDRHKTTVCVYSLRAKQQPTVSTPVTWQEVEKCLAKKDADLLGFTSDEVLKRVEKHGDLFEPVLNQKQKL